MKNLVLKGMGGNKAEFVKLLQDAVGIKQTEAESIADAIANGGSYTISDIPDMDAQELIYDFKQIGATVEEGSPDLGSGSVENPYVPIYSADDIHKLDRQETLQVLDEVGRIAKDYEQCNDEIIRLNAEIAAEKQKSETLPKPLSDEAKQKVRKIVIIAVVASVVTGGMLAIPAIIVAIFMYISIKNKDLQAHAAEHDIRARSYLSEHVTPLQNQLAEVRGRQNTIVRDGRMEWAIDVISKDLFYSGCIDDISNLIRSRRADSLKEALNKYDDTQHRERIEAMQQSIQNATELAAVEATKQTARLEQIEKNSHEAASAAKMNAAINYGTYKNTRRLR